MALATTPTTFPTSRLICNRWSASILLVGGAIAGIAGFDIAFDTVTAGVPLFRIALFVAMTIAGLFCASHVNLSILPHGYRYPILTAVALGLLVAIAIVFIDGVLFKNILPHGYVSFFAEQNLWSRLIYFLLRGFNEEVLYRLFLMSALVWSISLMQRKLDAKIPKSTFWIAILVAQVVPLTLNLNGFFPSPLSLVHLLYILIRFIAPGVLWGYLYWQHGLMTAEMAHLSTHVFLDPALSYLLA